jgi:transcriptional regulator with XRE-family HTH domain
VSTVRSKARKKFGKIFSQTRKGLGISQCQLARDCDLSTPQFISNIERGLAMPSERVLKCFCSRIKSKQVKDSLKESILDVYRKELSEIIR